MDEGESEWDDPTTLQRRQSKLKHGDGRHLSELERDVFLDDHLIPMNIFCKRHQTDPQYGITKARAEHLLQIYGPNKLMATKDKSRIWLFLKSFFGGFAILLWIGALLCIIAYLVHSEGSESKEHLYLGSVLIIVVIITGFFTNYQQRKSSKIIDAFKVMMPHHAVVIREGEKAIVSAEDIVIGDLILLKTGDRVPADMRIVECQNLTVDNSALTGESQPMRRTTEHTSDNPLETNNLAFSSTTVVEGTGKGIVKGCGDKTVMGRIAELTSNLTPDETPISKEIKIFIHTIAFVSMLFGLLIFLLALFCGYYWT